jgi:hypothetical protein
MESEPVLMEIQLSEARLTNGITNDGLSFLQDLEQFVMQKAASSLQVAKR